MLDSIWLGMILCSILFALFKGTIPELSLAIIESSHEAVTLCITLAGVVALWNGLMKLAERSGLMNRLAQSLNPVLRFLFPDIPEGHPALQHISANFVANFMGLGWAATPPGIAAMKSLQTLQPEKEEASDMMCVFMVMNLSSLQLIPINMLAYRMQYGSADPAAIVLPSLLATAVSTLTAVLFIRYKLRRRYR